MGMTRDEAIKKLDDLGFLTPEQFVDGLIVLGVLRLVYGAQRDDAPTSAAERAERKFNEA